MKTCARVFMLSAIVAVHAPVLSQQVLPGLDTELLLSALKAPSGEVLGELGGPHAAAIKAATRSTQPVNVQVRVVRPLAQEGCARLQVDIRQGGVPTLAGTLVDVQLPSIQLNICADGEPPLDGPRGMESGPFMSSSIGGK